MAKAKEVRKLVEFLRLKDPALFERIRSELVTHAMIAPRRGMAGLGEDTGFWDAFTDKISSYAGDSILNAIDKQRLNAQTDRARAEARSDPVAASAQARESFFSQGDSGLFSARNLMIGGGVLALFVGALLWRRARAKA